MEENFEALLDMYIDEEEIEKKIEMDNLETEKEEKKQDSKKDIRKFKEYAISMEEFLNNYLKINISEPCAKILTHRD